MCNTVPVQYLLGLFFSSLKRLGSTRSSHLRPISSTVVTEYENAETVSHLCISFAIIYLLMCFSIRIQLIAVVVGICPIRFIVRAILIGPILWCEAVKHRGATKSHAQLLS